MSQIKVITGNIFASGCQTIVNTINCEGVMGAGLALECRLRYPKMFEQYAHLCAQRQMDIGKLWLFRDASRWVLNFPTKKHWRQPSHTSYLKLGLQKFMQTYREKGIESVAFPLLGAQHGGLDRAQALELMLVHLEPCTIPVEIYRYDPSAADDVYDRFKALLGSSTDAQIQDATGLTRHRIGLLRTAIASPRVRQLNQLAQARGIGDKTLECAFSLTRMEALAGQASLL